MTGSDEVHSEPAGEGGVARRLPTLDMTGYRALAGHRGLDAWVDFNDWCDRTEITALEVVAIGLLDEGGCRALVECIVVPGELTHDHQPLTVVKEVVLSEPFPLAMCGPVVTLREWVSGTDAVTPDPCFVGATA